MKTKKGQECENWFDVHHKPGFALASLADQQRELSRLATHTLAKMKPQLYVFFPWALPAGRNRYERGTATQRKKEVLRMPLVRGIKSLIWRCSLICTSLVPVAEMRAVPVRIENMVACG